MGNARIRSFFVTQLSALLLITFAAGAIFGQERPPAGQRRPLSPESASGAEEALLPPLSSPQGPVNCAVAGRYIDDAIARASRAEDSFLIVIIRPGDGEVQARLNRLRLMQVKAYLEYTRIPKYTVAVGEQLKGAGHIEIYVKGDLLYILPFIKNEGLNLLSCVAV